MADPLATEFLCLYHLSSFENSLPSAGHTHELHELMFCLKGEINQLVGEEWIPHQKGELYLFPAGTLHMSHSGPRQRSESIVINVSPHYFDDERDFRDMMCTIMDKAKDERHFKLSAQGREAVKAHMLTFYEESTNRKPGYRLAFKNCMRGLLLILIREHEDTPICQDLKSSHAQLMEEVITYTSIRFDKDIQIDDILKFCPLSRSHFHAVFKEHMGMTWGELLLQYRLDYSRKLLRETDRKILSIALQSGFGSQSHFCHLFKKKYKTSPMQYRKVSVLAE